MEQYLTLLTEKQRTAYLLRMEGMTYKRIAQEMGVTLNAASQNVRGAEKRLRQIERYHSANLRNDQPINYSLTRGELRLMSWGLFLVKTDMEKKAVINVKTDWEGRLPYEYQIVTAMLKRAQAALYGVKSAAAFCDEETKNQG